MNLTNISEATERFEVLQTSKRSQSAMMTLASGASTGKKAEANRKSDQILLVQRGKLTGVVDPGESQSQERRRALDSGTSATPVHK